MPIYEYRCTACETKFEKLRSFSQANEPTVCPSCQGTESKRCLSTFAAFSKGSSGGSTAISGAGGGCSCGGSCGGGNCGSCGK